VNDIKRYSLLFLVVLIGVIFEREANLTFAAQSLLQGAGGGK
jgi:hypothetical protein